MIIKFFNITLTYLKLKSYVIINIILKSFNLTIVNSCGNFWDRLIIQNY